MKIISLLHRNCEFFSEISEFNSRVNIDPIKSKEALSEDWIALMAHNWISALGNKVQSLSTSDMQKLSINESDLMNMNAVLQDYDLSKRALQEEMNRFFNKYPYLDQRYSWTPPDSSDNFLPPEQSIPLSSRIEIDNQEYVISAMISLNNPPALESLKSLHNFEMKTKLMNNMIEHGAFDIALDISKNVNGKLIPVVYSNNVFGTKPIHQELLIKITQEFEKDHIILEHFSSKNTALLDFSNKVQLIPDILSECSHDNLRTGVTNESLLVFKQFVDEQKINELIVSPSVFTERLFSSAKKKIS